MCIRDSPIEGAGGHQIGDAIGPYFGGVVVTHLQARLQAWADHQRAAAAHALQRPSPRLGEVGHDRGHDGAARLRAAAALGGVQVEQPAQNQVRLVGREAVSYTHLDVYKRQVQGVVVQMST